MPSWSEIVSDVNQYSNAGNELDKKREEYLNKIRSITGRNVIAYYSGWLKVPLLLYFSCLVRDRCTRCN